MNFLMWIAAAVGIFLGVGIVAVVLYDVLLITSGAESLSHRAWRLARENPILPALVGLGLGLVAGIVIGHLYLPQYIEG